MDMYSAMAFQSFNQKQLQEKYDTITLTADDRQLALRTLKTIKRSDENIEVTDNAVRLVASLQCLLPPGKRVTPKVFQNWNLGILTQTQSVEELVLLVKRTARPNFDQDPEVAALLYRADEVDLPGTVDARLWWIVASSVNPQKLPKGVLRVKCSMSVSRSAPLMEAGDDAAIDADIGPAMSLNAEVQQSDVNPQKDEKVSLAEEPPPAPRPTRVLKPEKSADSDDEQLSEDIAVHTKKCFEAGCYWLSDGNSPNSAEFWLRAYVTWIKKYARQQLGRSQSCEATVELVHMAPHMQLYIKFVVVSLLAHRTFSVLPSYCVHFKEITRHAPGLVPPISHALQKIVDYPLDSDESLNIGDLGKVSMILYQSILYQDFLDHRRQRRLMVARDGKKDKKDPNTCLTVEKRLQLVELLRAEPEFQDDTEVQMQLQFAHTMLSTSWRKANSEGVQDMSEESLPKFLVSGDAQTFQMLKTWFPKHDHQCLQHFVMGAELKGVPSSKFMNGSILLANDELSGIVHHPVVKSCVVIGEQIHNILDDLNIEQPFYVQCAYHEACCFLLSLHEQETHSSIGEELPQMGPRDEVAKFLAAFSGVKMLQKLPAGKCVVLAEMFKIIAETSVRSNSTVSAETPVRSNGAETPVRSTGAVTPQEQQPAAARTAAAEEEDKEPLMSRPDLKEGDTVILHSIRKHADQFLNMKAEIVSINAKTKKCKVLVIEGPSEGKVQTFGWNQMDLFTPVAPFTPEGAGDAAGDTAGSEPAPKRQKSDDDGEARAAAMFGLGDIGDLGILDGVDSPLLRAGEEL